MISRYGIVYDLTISPYVVNVGETSFYFSSKNHKEKFLELLQNEIVRINTSLSNRFNFEIRTSEIIPAVVLYSKIEKRGFLIRDKGVDYRCLKHLRLNGEVLTKRI